MTKYALISVSDKSGIDRFASELKRLGFEIISTGGTYKFLKDNGLTPIEISEYTGFPEMLDGRVKTLHPKIHGGLLGRTNLDDHKKVMIEHDIHPIDIVAVNLYPFKETITNPAKTEEDAIENIDIGGPSMVRSAAKNFERTTIIVDSNDYDKVIEELSNRGETTLDTRKRLAAKAFSHTAYYDSLISNYLNKANNIEEPAQLTLAFDKNYPLRYGENPQQNAMFYKSALGTKFSIPEAIQLHGKELSFNNIKDADAAIRIIREFGNDKPVAVALKHMNPCGIGTGDNILDAFQNCFESDPVSIFGGIVVLNKTVTNDLANSLSKIFLEIIIAPGFEKEALEILTSKKNLRILELDFNEIDSSRIEKEFVSVLDGIVLQNQDNSTISNEDLKPVTNKKPTNEQLEAMVFANKCIKYIKSNAIVITNSKQILGVGAGQTNRVDSVKIAIDRVIQNFGEMPKDAVLASDAFFPFKDNIEEIAKAGIKAIIQPGGSVRDEEVVEEANKNDIAMAFSNVRNFRH